MELIDLSYEIHKGMPVYPGDIEVELENDKKVKEDGYSNHNLKMGMHTGTHLDLPAHMLKDNRYISDISLNYLSGRAILLNTAGQKVITVKNEYQDLIKKDDMIIIKTSFDAKYGQEEYYREHPVISEELAEFFVKKEIKLLGFDMPSPDQSPFKIHHKLFENNIFILENLCNLDKLPELEAFKLLIFPLKVRAEAAPCRVAAEI
ncbi:Kynurenine formamidase [Halanaerobium congolense]|uniref:Kynurenine formamidase n=1 Tax=Halanaerobium congolense TaxID=54121 RepID=A0A1I0AHQ3_9FIRM|nr:cyclase family protein [Halanaerobium congolense]PTX17434.1 kynurenine formamidase [Halanaerobium congolense]SDF44225.1 Kynurenine formamidase [Halanaerobium congolense]SES93681.1 Kynurenine formamidase [Halanaerobium congolense]SFP25243.1 Kynurenine formamidase [Halanaerobium congolense]